jgi:hypothetical protein
LRVRPELLFVFSAARLGGGGIADDYNHEVARGWESKSVEAQQAEASQKPDGRRSPMSAEEAARWREKENLRLARQRVMQQLETSQNLRHRKLMQEALAHLDEKLGE